MAEITRRPRTEEELKLEEALRILRENSKEIRRLAPFPRNLKRALALTERRVRRLKDNANTEHSG